MHILYVTQQCVSYFLKKKTANVLGCTNVILLHSNHQYVSTTSCGLPQGDEKENAYTIIMCRFFKKTFTHE